MKAIVIAIGIVASSIVGIADDANAQVRVDVNNRGLFNRRGNVNVNAAGVNVNVGRRGFLGNRQNVNINVNRNAAVRVDAFRNRDVDVFINARDNTAFIRANKVFRFNTFGTRTVVDQFGNVFEVDALGRAFLRGNRGGFSQFSGRVAVKVDAHSFVPIEVFSTHCH